MNTLLPNLIVIGAAKCGTTSLHTYLGDHPEVFATDQKELHFFISERSWSTWERGLDWYRDHFRGGEGYPVRVESSPGYSYDEFADQVAARMSSIVPNVRIIYMIRDPISRIRSHYAEELFGGRLPPTLPLREIIRSQGTGGGKIQRHFYGRLVNTSKYWTQLVRYRKYFESDQILLVRTEGLESQPLQEMRRILQFIGVNDDAIPSSVGQRLNRRTEKRLRVRDPASPIRRLWGYDKLVDLIPSTMIEWYREWTSRDVDYKVLSRLHKRDINYLRDVLGPDIKRLEDALDFDLSDWGLLDSH